MRYALWIVVATSMFVGGGAAVAAAGPEDVTLTTTTLPTLHPGQTAWVSTLWTGGERDAGSFVLRATGPPGVSISYPANTGSYSSLYKESTLLAHDTDYAALKIVVGADVVGAQTIALTVSYVEAAKGKSGKGKAKAVVKNLQVVLPVVEATGPAAQILTTTVGPLASGTAGFVEVSYKGVKPGLTGVAVTITSKPAGLTVTYPGDRSSSGLSQDSTLDVDETDSAAIRLDTGKLAPGSYPLGVDLAYGAGQHVVGSLTLVVS